VIVVAVEGLERADLAPAVRAEIKRLLGE